MFEQLNADLYDEKPKDVDPVNLDEPYKNNPEFTVAERKSHSTENTTPAYSARTMRSGKSARST